MKIPEKSEPAIYVGDEKVSSLSVDYVYVECTTLDDAVNNRRVFKILHRKNEDVD